ncbi:MAG: gfo/Idh/MocA family oxidoreductase [Spirochaetaceae bacterium]|nr:MAG: gfo/Idh/MocA family oxidoreductase [Spirochaetaceae bacterium]
MKPEEKRGTSARTLRVAVVGVGGYGAVHLASLQRIGPRIGLRLEAVVSVLPHNQAYGEAEREQALRRRNVRVYRSYQQLCDAERGRIDLISLPVGTPLHCPISRYALQRGYHVLCEKPAAGSLTDARAMAAERTTAVLAIGYQHLCTQSMRWLRAAAGSGTLGRLREAHTLVLWPRRRSYYQRNSWAGRFTAGGVPVNDCPLQNACSHFLQNMLFVAGAAAAGRPAPPGAEAVRTASPRSVYAENYRANQIETCDTQYARIETADGSVLNITALHACAREQHPLTRYVFERATLQWCFDGRILQLSGGPVEIPELPPTTEESMTDELYRNVAEAIRSGSRPDCTIDDALDHLRCVEAALDHGIVPIDSRYVAVAEPGDDPLTVVTGIEEHALRVYGLGRGFRELGCGWAVCSA